jgi:hypothetical protein
LARAGAGEAAVRVYGVAAPEPHAAVSGLSSASAKWGADARAAAQSKSFPLSMVAPAGAENGSVIGADASVVFGANAHVGGRAAPMGTKNLRAGKWSDDSDMSDRVGGSGESDARA